MYLHTDSSFKKTLYFLKHSKSFLLSFLLLSFLFFRKKIPCLSLSPKITSVHWVLGVFDN